MGKVKKQLRYIKRSLFKALVELFQINIAYKDKKYFYIKDVHKKDPFREDWENIGDDLRKSFDSYREYLEKENLIDHQISLEFENHLESNDRKEKGSREKQPI